jgi:predicted small secreted protein
VARDLAGGGGVRRFAGLSVLATTMVLVTALVSGCATARGAGPDGQRSPTPQTAANPAPEPVRCPDQGVMVSTGSGDAASGLRVLSIELVNCGTVPFVLNGYPALSVLDENGDPLDIEIIHGTSAIAAIDNYDTQPARIELRPGDRAVAGLAWRNLVTDSTVVATVGTQLAVAPAIGDPWQIVSAKGPVDLGNTGRIGITAWGPPKQS